MPAFAACSRCAPHFWFCANYKHQYDATTDPKTSSRTYEAVYGTIEAGGNINANVTGYGKNNAVRAGAYAE